MTQGAIAILIVDDEASMRRVLTRWFQLGGYATLTAGSGEEATEVLENNEVDIVLLDLRMPGMSGQTLYHVIVSRWPHLASRMIAMSGDLDSDGHREWIEANDVPVLAKPFELPDARRLVESLLRRPREANGR